MVRYSWPTWADILGHSLHQQGYEFYNLAMAGTGNEAIFHSLIRARHEFGFTEDDILLVMWSSWCREDRYLPIMGDPDNGYFWTVEGSVANSAFYDDDFLTKYWSLEHDVVKNITAITAARSIFNFAFEGSLLPLENSVLDDQPDELLSLLNDIVLPNNIPEGQADWSHGLHQFDGHPTIPESLSYLETVVLPATGLELDMETYKWARRQDFYIDKMIQDLSPENWYAVQEQMHEHFDEICLEFRQEFSAQDLWDSNGQGVESYLESFMQNLYNHAWER